MALKILFVEQYSRISGAEIITLKFFHILKKHYDIDIAAIIPGEGDLQKELEKLGARILFHDIPPVLSSSAEKKDVVNLLIKAAYDHGANMLYSNMIRAGYFTALTAVRTGIPMFWHLNETVTKDKLFFLLPVLSSRHVVPVAVSREVKRVFSPSRCEVLENPVSNGIIAQDKFDMNSFGYFGRLIPQKGVHLGLLRFREVLDAEPGATFTIYGDDRNLGAQYIVEMNRIAKRLKMDGNYSSYKRFLEDLILRHGMKERVFFKGFEPDINRIMSDISVVVAPSITKIKEAFGLTAFEAMRAGRLPVTSRSGAFDIYVKNGYNGFKIDFNKKGSLLNVYSMLKDDTLKLKQVIGNAREFSFKFSEGHFEEKGLKLLQKYFGGRI